jgi:hypothetical protein
MLRGFGSLAGRASPDGPDYHEPACSSGARLRARTRGNRRGPTTIMDLSRGQAIILLLVIITAGYAPMRRARC